MLVLHLDPLLVLMLETPHPGHTHNRSSLYIHILSVSAP